MLSMRVGQATPFRASTRAPARVTVARPVPTSSTTFIGGMRLGEREDASEITTASSGLEKWTMMRHGNRVKHLGRPADQRKALIRGLVTEVIRHGQIKTTKVKAMVIRKYVDHMITLAKKDTLHARRQALGFIYDPELVSRLFEGVQERYGDREGGYTRVRPDLTHPCPRRGDNTEMAVIELV
ncbi:hypothetical protein CEUSTIGMA_g6653.t1 [Chlamydomonas eustigma]|uniref:Large ribosomal subunit protein bL17c n=1 Tax=Chlamydomonas eustigma TaxID=1157962 RepID=A0A250X813_9CHLO|nr:hypothetical protein CEUSTIGMA_g6653.t1 [Chlamydomonas eustigma]|eukprot:GAX79213.1 hypothetical protein CEUSTIGMA_g6653.t1 [Chlamydomonas eustigma]